MRNLIIKQDIYLVDAAYLSQPKVNLSYGCIVSMDHTISCNKDLFSDTMIHGNCCLVLSVVYSNSNMQSIDLSPTGIVSNINDLILQDLCMKWLDNV